MSGESWARPLPCSRYIEADEDDDNPSSYIVSRANEERIISILFRFPCHLNNIDAARVRCTLHTYHPEPGLKMHCSDDIEYIYIYIYIYI